MKSPREGPSGLTKETMDRFDSLKESMLGIKESVSAAKLWAIGMYVTSTGTLLYVMVRGFKWL